jgi:hypothetical protein
MAKNRLMLRSVDKEVEKLETASVVGENIKQ